ncbi:MAG: tetratricopeptide repeat protein [Devosia sp.]|nr:tetratricopeptide repeat protein [Devosia sp.]
MMATVKAERNRSTRALVLCQMQAAKRLDDHKPDPTTTAKAVLAACATAFRQNVEVYRRTSAPGSQEAKRIVAALETGALGQAIQIVLKTRQTAASAAAADQVELGSKAAQRGEYATALFLWRPLADQGNANAQAALGALYELGNGVPQDYMEAVRWYREAADQGSANAQTALGRMYEAGRGVSQDYAEAARWYRMAADQGNANAQTALGIMYDGGHGVSQDYAEAARWFRAAADQGVVTAQDILGMYYYLGTGVSKDYLQTYMWWNLAAIGGDDNAAKSRDLVARSMTPTQIGEAQELGAAWTKAHSGRVPAPIHVSNRPSPN